MNSCTNFAHPRVNFTETQCKCVAPTAIDCMCSTEIFQSLRWGETQIKTLSVIFDQFAHGYWTHAWFQEDLKRRNMKSSISANRKLNAIELIFLRRHCEHMVIVFIAWKHSKSNFKWLCRYTSIHFFNFAFGEYMPFLYRSLGSELDM